MKNLRELFSLYPLDCESFGAEWLRRWEALGRLLQRQCAIEWWTYIDKKWLALHWKGTVAEAVEYIAGQYAFDPGDTWGRRMRIVLDGTIIREWGPK